MSDMSAQAKPREQSMAVRVIRADGTVEDHGVVAYWARNPIRRWAWAVRRRLKEF